MSWWAIGGILLLALVVGLFIWVGVLNHKVSKISSAIGPTGSTGNSDTLAQTFKEIFLLSSDPYTDGIPYDTGFVNPIGLEYDEYTSAVNEGDVFWVAVSTLADDLRLGTSTIQQFSYVSTTPTGAAVSLLQTIYGTGPPGFPPAFTNISVLPPDNTNFVFEAFGQTGPAQLLVTDRNGCIYAYNSDITSVLVPVIDHTASGACYFDADHHNTMHLYVTNFASGYIEMYDGQFQLQMQFTDPSSMLVFDDLYHPFGLHLDTHNELIYVSFAENDNSDNQPVPHDGNGFVDIFQTDGTFVIRLQSDGYNNIPYGFMHIPSTVSPSKTLELWSANHGNGIIQRFSANNEIVYPLVASTNRNVMNTPYIWDILYLPKATSSSSTLHVIITQGADAGHAGILKSIVASPPDNIP
jgi:uncharacterized protein (TIGR03118 family)